LRLCGSISARTATILAVVKLILISVIVGAVSCLLRAVRVGDREAEVLSKTTASLIFVVLGAIAWLSGNPVATWLIVGLALCAAGDVLLIWDRTFDLGLMSFLLGHVAYVAAFHTAAPITGWTRWMLLPIVLVSFGALVWLWPHLGRRRISVSAYVLVITIMVWGALAVTSGGVLGWKIAIGAVLFYLSDLTVARDRFVQSDFLNRGIGLPMYYAAQILIALSV
jgi:uncharacterized membrane protein YhhN